MQLLEFLKKPGKYISLTRDELEALPEYSISLPTGVIIGKRWKRNINFMAPSQMAHPFDGAELRRQPDWWIGEFVTDPNPKRDKNGNARTVMVQWYKAILT